MFTFTFTFTNREEYLADRREWKAIYKELSQEIRDTRAAIKKAYADGNRDRASYLQFQKAELRKKANRMMIALTEAKAEAQRQYEETQKAAA